MVLCQTIRFPSVLVNHIDLVKDPQLVLKLLSVTHLLNCHFFRLLDDNPRLAMESLVHMTEVLSASERKELLTLLLKQEETAAVNSEK